MSKRVKWNGSGAMLELWRPPQAAGDPIGCLATTYTFEPGLFDEQCLGRFLEIESEPDREDLAFLLERETRLGSIYAGVLVDHSQAGVEHSLRWDVLRIRLRSGKQHAKISLLAWNHHIRIIVSSANLTESGYRFNQEVAGSLDLTPNDSDGELLGQATQFLSDLMGFVPGAPGQQPEVQRARKFLDDIEQRTRDWKISRQRETIRRRVVFTLPASVEGHSERSSLEETFQVCRNRGVSPSELWISSPFFDVKESGGLTAAVCKLMGRGVQRHITFCVPSIRDEDPTAIPRLAAPKALFLTPPTYNTHVTVEMLPDRDAEKNRRPWHAKMIALRSNSYAALLIGSSNFTSAGLGVGKYRNAEANLLSLVDFARDIGEVRRLDSVWPQTDRVIDPDAAEWLGSRPELEEEEQSQAPVLPGGFLSATYRAGDDRVLVLQFDPERLPEDWQIYASGPGDRELISASSWKEKNRRSPVEIEWSPVEPPSRLLVKWDMGQAFLPLNVEDTRALPPPEQLENMSADDMLLILAAADPSAAFRAWTKQQQTTVDFDAELDSATPLDLDPLRRYDLQATFLHRVRRRARVLAQLRANLERPVYSRRALEWRLRGLLGVESLADRLVRDIEKANGTIDEALLTLADFLIVLGEVNYQPAVDSLAGPEFDQEYRSFLRTLAKKLGGQIAKYREHVPKDLLVFWEKVLQECRR